MRFLRNSLFILSISLAGLGSISAQTHDISSGGLPTITGSSGGSVTGSASVLNDLVVTINFNELSPSNINNIVKVTVPIAVRSNQPYQVGVTASGSINTNAQALQGSDIGFGVNNFRAMGANSRICVNSPHIFYSPFSNDPAANVTINASGRAAYPSTINNIGASTVILSGPRLSSTKQAVRQTDNGYIFDAIFTITPQFYATGTTSVTLVFTISAGPNVPC